jgi:hypothetical protein
VPRKSLAGKHNLRSRSKRPTRKWRNRYRNQDARIRTLDFDDLLEAQGPQTRSAFFELYAALSPELLALILNVPSTKVHNHIPDDAQRETIGELLRTMRSLDGYPYEQAPDATRDALLRYDRNWNKQSNFLHEKSGGTRPQVADNGTLVKRILLAYNHYAVGWAHALCAPYQWTKQVASHWGGTRNGTVVHWPNGFAGKGEIRNQFHHVRE